jgi:hypothetical protein
VLQVEPRTFHMLSRHSAIGPWVFFETVSAFAAQAGLELIM